MKHLMQRTARPRQTRDRIDDHREIPRNAVHQGPYREQHAHHVAARNRHKRRRRDLVAVIRRQAVDRLVKQFRRTVFHTVVFLEIRRVLEPEIRPHVDHLHARLAQRRDQIHGRPAVKRHEDHVALFRKAFSIKGFQLYRRRLCQGGHHLAERLAALQFNRRHQLRLGVNPQKPNEFTTGIPDRTNHTCSYHLNLLVAKNNRL